jgi:hypothetical protein
MMGATSTIPLDQWLFHVASLCVCCYFAFTGALAFVRPEVFFEFSDLWRKSGPDAMYLERPWRKRWGEKLVGLAFVAFGSYGGTIATMAMVLRMPGEIIPIPRSNAWEFLLLSVGMLGVGLFIATKARETNRRMLGESLPGLLLTTERTIRLRTLWLRLGGITLMVGGLMPLGQWIRSLD